MAEPSHHGRMHAWRMCACTIIACGLMVAGFALPVRAWAQSLERTDRPESPEEPAAFVIDDAATMEGDGGVRSLVFVVRLTAPLLYSSSVFVSTLDSTATTADHDYDEFGFRLTFPAGSTAESLSVNVSGDAQVERTECFQLRLRDAMGASIADSIAAGTIINDDFALLTIDDETTIEGDVGLKTLTFSARLSQPVPDTVVVAVSTFDGTATTADADYVALQNSVVFAPGSTTEAIHIKVLGDVRVEPDQSFYVRLRQARGAVLADSEAVATLVNDDQPTLTVDDTLIAEGDSLTRVLPFRIRLSEPAVAPVTFHYQTVDGTAQAADLDYLPAEGDTVILAGQDQITIGVTVIGDTLLESNDRFTLEVSGLVGATPARLTGIGTVSNDERPRFARIPVNVPMYVYGTLPPAWGDGNGDGLPDLPLYQNAVDHFVEMPGMRSLLGTGNYHGAAWCDFDRDGDDDFIQLPYGGPERADNRTRLFRNGPTGFQDVAPSSSMGVVGFGETPAWADFNADGWPDVFMPFYAHEAPYRSFLFMNQGDGLFVETGDSAGVSLRDLPAGRRPEGIGATDWNGDGAIDVYCANHLFINDGDGRFVDVRAQVGLPQVFDEGSQFVDYDDDGDFDLYMRIATGPALFRNDNGQFTNVTSALGIGFLDWEWGDRWADLDSDGDLDFMFFPPSTQARLMLNNGDGTFREDSTFIGTFMGSSLSSYADMDGDGDIDIAVGANGRMIARNLTDLRPRANVSFIKVRVVDDQGFRVMQGASVRLRALDDPKHPVQTRYVDGGSGYLGQDEYTLTFGGVGTGTYDLEVTFPSKPGAPRVVGPAQNALLAGLRPSDAGPLTVTVRPNGSVSIERPPSSPNEGPVLPPGNEAELQPSSRLELRTGFSAAPNPARDHIRFSAPVSSRGDAILRVLDLNGRCVRMLHGDANAGGMADLTWDLRGSDGQRVPAGMYFVHVSGQAARRAVRRVIVLP